MASVRWLFASTALGFGGMFLTLAALPAEAVRHGASPGVAGIVTTVLFAATVLMQVFVGRLVTRLGLLPSLALGLVALGLPAPLYLLDYGLPWWLAVSAVRGAGFGVVAVIGSLLAARIVAPSQLGRSIGLYGLAIAISNLIGTPLGVALASAGHFGWVALFATMPLLAIACLAPIHRRPADPGTAAPRAPAATRRVIRLIIGPSFVLFAVTFTGGGLVSYLPIERPSGSSAAVALFVFSATGALCRFAAGSLADRIGSRVVLTVGISIAVVGVIALGSTVGLVEATPLVLAAAVFGLGFGTAQNLTLVMTFGRAGVAGAATASAFWNGAFDLGTSIGAYVIGAIAASSVGLGWTLGGCAVLIGVSVLTLREPQSMDGPVEPSHAS
jgi:MFS family permease